MLQHPYVPFSLLFSGWSYIALDMEFVTRVTSLARVKYFWVWEFLSRIYAKNTLFCVIFLFQARNFAVFHKTTGVSLYLSTLCLSLLYFLQKKLTICLKHMSKTSSILKFLPKMSRFGEALKKWFLLGMLGPLLPYGRTIACVQNSK